MEEMLARPQHAKYQPRNWVVRGRERPRSFGPAASAGPCWSLPPTYRVKTNQVLREF